MSIYSFIRSKLGEYMKKIISSIRSNRKKRESCALCFLLNELNESNKESSEFIEETANCFSILNKRIKELASVDDNRNLKLPTIDFNIITANQTKFEKKIRAYKSQLFNESVYNNYLDNQQKLLNFKNLFEQYKRTISEVNEVMSLSPKGEYIFFQYGLDKDNELMCAITNYSDFFNSGRSCFSLKILFGQNQEMENNTNKDSFLDYDCNPSYNGEEGIIEINLLLTSKNKIRKYHGTFALDALINLVYKINKEIVEVNSNSKNVIISEIASIKGDIKPTRGMTYEEVFNFYNKNGFIEANRLYRKM